jgi:hypothetical protein
VPDLATSRAHVFLAPDVPLDRAAGYLEDAASLLALHLARPHLLNG